MYKKVFKDYERKGRVDKMRNGKDIFSSREKTMDMELLNFLLENNEPPVGYIERVDGALLR